jgi:hypothetical protein
VSRSWALAGLILAAIAVSAAPALAIEVRATADRTEVTSEEQIILTVTIEGSMSASPELPPLPDFTVFRGRQGTEMSFVNGRRRVAISYGYYLRPLRAGTFTIGPVSAVIDGERYQSEPFEVRVLAASDAPREERDIYITVTVSTTTPYVGQQVLYVWRLYRRIRIGEARLDPVEFPGFLVEDLGQEPRDYETVVGGQAYLVSELRKALFPQEVGRLTVPGSRLSYRVAMRERSDGRSLFDEVFGTTRTEGRVLHTQPIELDVRSPPPAPPGFSGLVGDFSVDAKVSRRELKVGESTTLDITVGGTGNVQLIAEPRVEPLAAFKVYDDQPTSKVSRDGHLLSGSRSFHKALVPMQSGELTLPAAELTFFDPEEEAYRVARSEPITLSVFPSDSPEDLRLTESLAPTTGKVSVRILADDILPLHKGAEVLSGSRFSPVSRPWLLALWLALPPLGFAAHWALDRRRRHYLENSHLRRRREALRRARRALRGARSEGEASRCLRGYIGDKLGVEGSALTPAEVRAYLSERRVSAPLLERACSLLERLEAAEYGRSQQGAAGSVDDVSPLLADLERELGR